MEGRVFGMCRFGKVGIMGLLWDGPHREGMGVRVRRCGIRKGAPFFEFEPAEDQATHT